MLIKRVVVLLLLFAGALSTFVRAAVAQSGSQQSVIVYVEFKPADTKTGSELLQDLASTANDSPGVIRFDVLQQIDRRNFFALSETWTSAQTFANFENSPVAQNIFTQLMRLVEAPLDERPGNLLAGTLEPRNQHAQARQIFVITHVDVDPQFVGQIRPLLNTFVSDSLRDAGVETFALVSQTPTANHFQLVETFANQKVFDDHVSASHTVIFRTNTDASLGAPYDERLYHFVSR